MKLPVLFSFSVDVYFVVAWREKRTEKKIDFHFFIYLCVCV